MSIRRILLSAVVLVALAATGCGGRPLVDRQIGKSDFYYEGYDKGHGIWQSGTDDLTFAELECSSAANRVSAQGYTDQEASDFRSGCMAGWRHAIEEEVASSS